jgi:hypothetical protein
MAMSKRTGITAFIDQCKRWIENYQKTLQLKRDKNQVERSGVAEAPGPELPLEIGSELLITDDIVKIYKNLSNALGRVVIIDAISIKEKEVIKASAFGIQVDVNMSTAQKMREAFLRRERLPL